MCKKSLLFFGVIILLQACAGSSMAEPNLVAHWKMDEPNIVDPCRIDDYSGNGNYGIFKSLEAGVSPPLVDGGAARYSPGIIGNFLDINGRWRTDEHSFECVTVPDATELDFGTGDFSISMWVDMMGGSHSPLLNKGTPGGPGYELRIGGNKDLYFAISDGTDVTACTTAELGVGWMEHYNWEHFAAVRDGSTLKLYHNGELVGTKTVITTGSIDNSEDILMGRDPDADLSNHSSGWSQSEWDAHPWVDGQYDDVRLYNKALSPSDFNTVFPYAWGFSPADHAGSVLSSGGLSWEDGSISKHYDVYFGTDHDDVYNANTTAPLGVYEGRVLNDANMYELTSVNLETTYYWRIDSLNDACDVIWTSKLRKRIGGIWYDLVWEFTSAGLKAAVPSPTDEAIFRSQDSNLAWMPGSGAVSHDVYFGTNEVDVTAAGRLLADINGDGPVNYLDIAVIYNQWLTSPGSSNPSADIAGDEDVDLVDYAFFADDWRQPPDAEFKGNQPSENTTYNLPTLSLDTTYYWRIDEVGSGGETVKGDVWSFTTINALGIYNVKDHGAIGDGSTSDTDAINAAIAAAHANGGGTVYFPTGTYKSGSIVMEDNITLDISANATLLATSSAEYSSVDYNPWGDLYEYQDWGHSHWKASLIWGVGVDNVAITGTGLINGDAMTAGDPSDGYADRTISFKHCNGILIKDISIYRAGHFAIITSGCNDIDINNVTIDTNRDGINIDCCNDVNVTNCTVNSPKDDAICLKSSYCLGYKRPTQNVNISNCTVMGHVVGYLLDPPGSDDGYNCGSIKFGTESNGGFKNITITDCTFELSRGFMLATVDGGDIENINIDNIQMTQIVDPPIFLRLGNRARGPGPPPPGTYRNINISNVTAATTNHKMSCIMSGIPGHYIEDVNFSNLNINYSGGGTAADATIVLPEKEDGYPYGGMFGGVTPSYAFYVRHADGVEFHDSDFSFTNNDLRPPFVLIDVSGFELDSVDTE